MDSDFAWSSIRLSGLMIQTGNGDGLATDKLSRVWKAT
jgi:hypothetical protein